MLTKTIRAVVRNGRIEPSETLDAPEGTEVTVEVPVPPPPHEARMVTFGMFAKTKTPSRSEQDETKAKAWLEQGWERSWERLNSNE
ncbi:MAG TPA: hypothetical protein VGR35_12365 [Tepidisphaeraceae bacterium]|nr:hypothetical protein [Tepidisphaeraceae bacterium]